MNGDKAVVWIVLLAFMLASVVLDLRARRIPNIVVFLGAAIAVGLNAFLAGGIGVGASLAGWGCGLLILLPMYVLHSMGAGDVKLMAMVGAFLGPWDVLGVALVSLVVGGVLAMVSALWHRQLFAVLGNVLHMMQILYLKVCGFGTVAGDISAIPSMKTTGHLPYAVAITVGTVIYVAWSVLRG